MFGASRAGDVSPPLDKQIQYAGNGERIKGLQQILPGQAAIVVRIFEELAADLPLGEIVRRLNAEGVPPPRSGKRGKKPSLKAPA